MKKQTKISKFFNIFASGVTAFSVTFFVANLALAQYTGPALPPPDGNVNGVIWNLDPDKSLNNTPQNANVFISGVINATQLCFPGTPTDDCISSWSGIDTPDLWFPNGLDKIYFNRSGSAATDAPKVEVKENGTESQIFAKAVNNNQFISQVSLTARSAGVNDRDVKLVWGDDAQVPFILRYTNFNGVNRDVLTASTNGNITMGLPSGNVGIGVSSPTQNLETTGNVRINGGNLYIGTTQNQRISRRSDASGVTMVSGHDTTSAIGLTDAQSTAFGYVWGSEDTAGTTRNIGFLDSDGHWSYLAQRDNYTAFLINNSEKMRITSDSRVGIGTSGPWNGQVHIKNTSSSFTPLRLEAAANDISLYLGYNSTNDTNEVNSSYGSTGSFKPLTLHTKDFERVRLNTEGNLLVNTTTDTYLSGLAKLVVEAKDDGINDGNIKPTAAFFISSDPTGTGVIANGGANGIVATGGNKGVQGIGGTWVDSWGGYFENGIKFGQTGLVQKYGAIDEAGGWTNIGSNFYYDGAWKKIVNDQPGASLHIKGSNTGTWDPQFRFRTVNADGTNAKNIVQIGSDLMQFGEVNPAVTQIQGVNFWSGVSFNSQIGSPSVEGGQIALVGNGTNKTYILDQYSNSMRIFGFPGTNTNNVASFYQNGSTDGRMGVNLNWSAIPASALQVNGTVRAQQYCNYDGTSCSSSPSGGGGGTSGVTKIIAGSGISISPTGGTGDVTITATGGGGGTGTPTTETKQFGCWSNSPLGSGTYCGDGWCSNGCKASCGPNDPDTARYSAWTITKWENASLPNSSDTWYRAGYDCNSVNAVGQESGIATAWCYNLIYNAQGSTSNSGNAGGKGICQRTKHY